MQLSRKGGKTAFNIGAWGQGLASILVLPAALFITTIMMPSAARAASVVLDAPHNESNHISCGSCHGTQVLESEYMKSGYQAANIDATPFNLLCKSCHTMEFGPYTDSFGPKENTHSSLTTDNGYGDWTRQCTTCHNPHSQEQKFWKDADAANRFLATGKIVNYVYHSDTETSILTYDTAVGITYRGDWTAARLLAKTNDHSKAILFPNTGDSQSRYSYVVVAISDDPLDPTITVKGNVKRVWTYLSKNPLAPTPFGIMYGQYIKQYINNKPVKFFDNQGDYGFADGNDVNSSFDGVCEVCHVKTASYGQDSGYGDFHRDTQGNTKNTPRTNCIECHKHEVGFAHRSDGTGEKCGECHNSGKHSQHMSTEIGVKCSGCHDLKNMRVNGQIVDPRSTGRCEKCHNNGIAERNPDGSIKLVDGKPKYGPPNHQDYMDPGKWTDPAYNLSCDGCHNGRPGLDAMVMATGGHDRLVGVAGIRQYPCWYCHGTTIRNYKNVAGQRWSGWRMTDRHFNRFEDIQIVDVQVAPEWAVAGADEPVYPSETAFDKKNCLNTACHTDPDAIMGMAYPPHQKNCLNTYCHTDGTSPNPEMRPYPWDTGSSACNSCHGHNETRSNCADCHTDGRSQWAEQENWLRAMPAYENSGPGTSRANSHFRHLFSGFTCDECHANTLVGACQNTVCHGGGIPDEPMGDEDHINPTYHVNRTKDVVFKDGGTYNRNDKTCANTSCHKSAVPQWGGSVDGEITCIKCHGTTGPDVDDFGMFNDQRALLNLTEWETVGHGRPLLDGSGNPNPYPQSNNPGANFDRAKGCWYCHDSNVLHETATNPFRLRQHQHFKLRFERECAFCHMLGENAECMHCHNDTESLVQDMQVANIAAVPGVINPPYTIARPDHAPYAGNNTSCASPTCHVDNATRHKIDPEVSSEIQNAEGIADIKNQYVMMGVCLKCHDDDSGGQCQACHEGDQYKTGFDPGLPDTGFIKPLMAKASSFHFGYKHYKDYVDGVIRNGVTVKGLWKGGKFCWDCHDPHGDANSFSVSADDKYNIYMIQTKIATETDGQYGKPVDSERRAVKFVRSQSGQDYARSAAPYNGVCNVCHEPGLGHFSRSNGDGHNAGRRCTNCHEHRFTDSHAGKDSCDTCHHRKPVPRHTAFGLPRDCVKCHDGTVKKRMNIMGQFRANSHHVQRADNTVTNKDCYQCHWESTPEGLIDLNHHTGYNYKTHATVTEDRVDLVVWGPGARPSTYDIDGSVAGTVTAATFRPGRLRINDPDPAKVLEAERREVEKITPHCLSCHSTQNNDSVPFDDCKTPRQYAWDRESIEARYSDPGTTLWGKYNPTMTPSVNTSKAARKELTKAFSAHGNAVNNAGGFSPVSGVDSAIANTRAGAYNVQCFDCHSSHGSSVTGITSSYVTFNGTRNGGNLKETQGGTGGYANSYKATAIPDPDSVNPFNAGAGQCFDCHESPIANVVNEWGAKTPWGYSSTFGAEQPIVGYRDNKRFSGTYQGIAQSHNEVNNGKADGVYLAPSTVSYAYRAGKSTKGGHLKASAALATPAKRPINGLCTPCHDPHGVSPTLGANRQYGVPLLKGTYMTSPYREDSPPPNVYGPTALPALQIWGANHVLSSGSRPREPVLPETRFNIDRNTFDDPINNNTFISETDQQFAGLCLKCHPKASLTNAAGDDQNFRTVDRIHEAVKGWGTATNEHQFPCSKCHEPHATGLPRLMQTNCLDYNHRGGAVTNGLPNYSRDDAQSRAGVSDRSYPIANLFNEQYSNLHNYDIDCHARVKPAQNPGQADWKTKQLWNNVTLW